MITLDFVPGDIVRVFQRIQEGEKVRTQVFEGVVLHIRGRGENKSFAVQKMVGNVAVERIWPVNSPFIDKIVVKGKALKGKKVRHSHLSYLRKTKTNN
ncbi:MAG TPA: 50S ribosomal protein L19 [Candidatus Saccharimonadales bacterium]|nr:50S ribosomal protein L19 [Candidatus Saccharimonadales bacterium]